MEWNLGEQIQRARRQRKWTREQTAQKLEMSAVQLARLEDNQRPPTVLQLRQLAIVYGISTDELLGIDRLPSIPLPQTLSADQRALIEDIVSILLMSIWDSDPTS